MQTLTTPLQFFNEVVAPDVAAFEKDPHSVRLAIHAVASLHHLRDWVFKAQPDIDKEERKRQREELLQCDAIKEIRELASNAKHFPPDQAELRRFFFSAPAAPSPLRPTWPEIFAETVDGADISLRLVVREAFEFWQGKVNKGEWGLK